MSKADKKVEILIVDDNSPDVRLIQEYFKDEKMVPHNLHTVGDGLEAMLLLERKGKYQNYPHPDIILLDLYMPKMDGREVLKRVREKLNSGLDSNYHVVVNNFYVSRFTEYANKK